MLSHQICNDRRLWEAYPTGTTASNRVSKQTSKFSPRRDTMVHTASEKPRKVCEASRKCECKLKRDESGENNDHH